MVEKRLLAVFIVTCALGLAVVLDLFQLHVIVLFFLAFVRYQQNHHQKVGRLRLCRGTDILKFDKKSTDL